MDDIRRPQRPQRRDYALPTARPHAPHPGHPPHAPRPNPAQPEPHSPHVPHQPTAAVPQPAQPVYNHQPQPVSHPPAQHYNHNQHAASAKPTVISKRPGRKITIAAGAVLAAAAIFGAGWLLKGSEPQNTIPASITRQVNYNLYFPSPMPSGYTYMKDTATFQIGQVFYKFSDGKKRVTVNEQPKPETPPNLSQLTGYTQFDSPAGKAAVGINLGEPAAIVITPTTVITMNSVGGVTQNDLKSAVNNLKNIGQRNQKS